MILLILKLNLWNQALKISIILKASYPQENEIQSRNYFYHFGTKVKIETKIEKDKAKENYFRYKVSGRHVPLFLLHLFK
jgi:hypothetical protein